jgi:hypothetical protein
MQKDAMSAGIAADMASFISRDHFIPSDQICSDHKTAFPNNPPYHVAI